MSIDFSTKCEYDDTDLTVTYIQTPVEYWDHHTAQTIRTDQRLEQIFTCRKGHTNTKVVAGQIDFNAGMSIISRYDLRINVEDSSNRPYEIRNELRAMQEERAKKRKQEVLTQQAVSIFFNLA